MCVYYSLTLLLNENLCAFCEVALNRKMKNWEKKLLDSGKHSREAWTNILHSLWNFLVGQVPGEQGTIVAQWVNSGILFCLGFQSKGRICCLRELANVYGQLPTAPTQRLCEVESVWGGVCLRHIRGLPWSCGDTAYSVSALGTWAAAVDMDFVALSRNKSAWEDSGLKSHSSFVVSTQFPFKKVLSFQLWDEAQHITLNM